MGTVYGHKIVTDGLVLYLDAANTKSYQTLDITTGWRLPYEFHIKGVLSTDRRSWSSEPEAQGGYSSVVLNKTFEPYENFEVVAYWARNYRGIAMIYGSNVSHLDFNGYSADSHGPYMGGLTVSGFPSGYSASYYGQYHSPISGDGAATTGYWFKWARHGNTLSIQYSATSATGPWTNVEADVTCNTTDKVIVGAGEASSVEVSDLAIISITNYSAHDLSGNKNGGTFTNGLTYDSANGGSLVFDGTDDYIDLSSDIMFKAGGGWTVESWVNLPTVTAGSLYNFIGASTNSYNSWYWTIYNSKLALWNISPGAWLYGNTTIQINTWYQCVLVCNDAGTGMQFYLNGIAESGTHTSYSWNSSYSSLMVRYLGRSNAANARYMKGRYSVAKIYNRALTSTEVLQNYNALKGRFGL